MRPTAGLLLAAIAASTAVAHAAPRPGTCQYRKAPNGQRTSVKLCAISGNYAEFRVKVAQGVPVLVKIAPDQLTSSVRPDPNVLSFAEQNGLLVYEPLIGTFNKPVVAQISTQGGLDITLRFEVSANPDTQVHILRADQADRDAACDRRVEALRTELSSDYEKKEEKLKTRARKEGRQWVLKKVLSRFSADSIKYVAFDDFLRIRARQRIRMGDIAILKVEIDERNGKPVTLDVPRAFLSGSGGRRPALSDAACDRLRLGPGDSAFCAIAVKLPEGFSTGDRIDIAIGDARKTRAVTLEGVDVR